MQQTNSYTNGSNRELYNKLSLKIYWLTATGFPTQPFLTTMSDEINHELGTMQVGMGIR